MSPDAFVIPIPDITVDIWVDPCDEVQNIDENYCECHPRCCQRQTWYCPPLGTEILAKDAILDICGEDHIPCDRNLDETCPPAEIIYESSCNHAFDCPPGINEDFTMYYDCDIGGVTGRQEVRCDKGRLYYGECLTCIPSDEICDLRDNDCDGEVDENQLNQCGECGQLQQDTCDGFDNDCDGSIDENLVRECTTDCERGIEVCLSGNWIGCTARRPSEEVCDGQDNDCDALPDEGLNCQCPPEMIGALLPCMEPPLTCGMGFKACECDNEDCTLTKMSDCLPMCAWLPPEIVSHDDPDSCDTTMGIPISPEMCNNYDEDCDSLIDENLEKSCYSGPDGTFGVGVCRTGTMVCQQGRWYGETQGGNYVLDLCVGETVPSREICDGADNDCDGITDFGTEIPETDILFIVDWSGSMEYNINAVKMAMNRFATHFSAEEKLKWGLVTGPRVFPVQGVNANQLVEFLKVDSDISSFADFMSAFSSAGGFEYGSSSEMLRDAIYLSIKTISTNLPYDLGAASWVQGLNPIGSFPPLEDFRINWRDGADKIIILFTDEEDQTFLNPPLEKTDVVAALGATQDILLYVFTRDYIRRHWSPLVSATGGTMFNLSSSADTMYEDLMSILDEICLSGAEQNARSTQSEPTFFPVSSQVQYDYVFNICL